MPQSVTNTSHATTFNTSKQSIPHIDTILDDMGREQGIKYLENISPNSTYPDVITSKDGESTISALCRYNWHKIREIYGIVNKHYDYNMNK